MYHYVQCMCVLGVIEVVGREGGRILDRFLTSTPLFVLRNAFDVVTLNLQRNCNFGALSYFSGFQYYLGKHQIPLPFIALINTFL